MDRALPPRPGPSPEHWSAELARPKPETEESVPTDDFLYDSISMTFLK